MCIASQLYLEPKIWELIPFVMPQINDKLSGFKRAMKNINLTLVNFLLKDYYFLCRCIAIFIYLSIYIYIYI